VAPAINLTLEADALTVEDDGPGIPASTIEHSLDCGVRISDKKYYASSRAGS
jgi:hypothetical protein